VLPQRIGWKLFFFFSFFLTAAYRKNRDTRLFFPISVSKQRKK